MPRLIKGNNLVWVYYISLVVLSIVGLFLNILGLPGLWLLVTAAAAFAWATGWDVYVGWPSLVTLVVLGLIAELLEFLAGAAGSKAAGGRTRGMIGAVVGALIGGILFSFVPVPIIATIVGACLGAFVGAAGMELSDKDFRHAMKVGYGAAKGRLLGIVVKTAVGVVMLLVVMIAALPIGGAVPAPSTRPMQMVPPATIPSTVPSSFPTTTTAPSTAP